MTRALSGNTLSWAYVFEWPIFAGYAVFMWWKLIHEPPAGARGDGRRTSPTAMTRSDDSRADPHAHRDEAAHSDTDGSPGEDEELASYNRYLAALNASGKRKHW